MTRPFVIPKRLVWEAFQRVKANGGSAGVDQESIETFESKLGDNLYKLWSRMESGSYFSAAGQSRSDPEEKRGYPNPRGAYCRRSSSSDGGQGDSRANARAGL